MLEARGVSIQRGRREVVHEASVQVTQGELVALIGPNGAGKSTLLGALAGDLPIHEGDVLLEGRALPAWSSLALARRRAVLPQHATLSFGFRALEVVLMGRAAQELASPAQDRTIAKRALSLVGLEGFEERRYTELSGGERQRVQLARVLAQLLEADEPGYLMLDEPTASLDLARAHQALAITKSLVREGMGALVVVHDLNLATRYADRIVMMHRGRVLSQGTPWEVVTCESLEQAFELRTRIDTHPETNTPLIVPLGTTLTQERER